MSQISPTIVQHLVVIGRTGRFEELESLAGLPDARGGDFMRTTRQEWESAAAHMARNDVVYLCKALTLLEALPHFRAGSVSPVIWLFRLLPESCKSDDLINWILSHTDNDYLPFGRSNHGAKSIEELQLRSKQVAERARAREDAEQARHVASRTRKAAEASHDLFGALRRKDEKAVRALLARGADLHARNDAGQTAIEYAEALGIGTMLRGGT